MIDRATALQPVHSSSRYLSIFDGANDDEGVKTAAMDWLSRICRYGKNITTLLPSAASARVMRSSSRVIAGKRDSNSRICLAVTVNGVKSNLQSVHYADECAAVIGENGYTLDGSTVTSAQYSEYDGRPMRMEISYGFWPHMMR